MFVNIDHPDTHNLKSSFNLPDAVRPEITNLESAFARFRDITWINGDSFTVQPAKYPFGNQQVVRKPIKLLHEILPKTLRAMSFVAPQSGEIDLSWYHHV
jgi:hypothetical protein